MEEAVRKLQEGSVTSTISGAGRAAPNVAEVVAKRRQLGLQQ